jgi:DNA mismatch repair protein MutS
MATETTHDEAMQTPVMRQYFAAKQAHPDCLMFCRIGDFYELFYEDAIVASRELQLTLTARDREKKQPMCGVPYHAAEPYIQRLLRKGYRIALCEQMEDPKLTKKIVRREVTRVLTPGTALDSTLGAEQSNLLASIVVCPANKSTEQTAGLALLDLSTGEFRATEFTGPSAWAQLTDELSRLRPVELLHAETLAPPTPTSKKLAFAGAPENPGGPFMEQSHRNMSGDDTSHTPDTTFDNIRTRTPLDAWVFTSDYALPLLRRHFNLHSLDGIGLGQHEAAAIAAGALLHYTQKTMQGGLEHVDLVRFYERSGSLALDAVSVRNLELVEPLFSGESSDTTLFHTLDACCTPMGKRLLRATLLRPSNDLIEITARLDAVAEAAVDLRKRESIRRAMDGLLDLERLLGRVALDSAGPREVLALAASLACLPPLLTAIRAFTAARWLELAGAASKDPVEIVFCTESAPISTGKPALADFSTGKQHPSSLRETSSNHSISTGFSTGFPPPFDPLSDLHATILRTLADEPPANLADGNVIRPGVDPELDGLRELSRSGRQSLVGIEERERARTGITSLKVRFNSVFGYYIEITKANARAVPADYERKQTLVNAERFTTPELKDYETKILTAQERSGEIEHRLFAELRQTLLASAPRIRATSRRVAEIDLLANFAHLAALRGWTRPTVDRSSVLEFVAARHPVVERRLEDSGTGRFVPNSTYLETEAGPSILLITGPNMGGKSTYLRQTALLAIMAQSGCFVPAERMRLGLVDRIYTRIGASDNVARGRSTFMVEMTETAAILNTATSRSLVLLDEMGRGTATYDGLSLAWATVEHLHERIGARTLFATHYHELTLLADRLPRLANLRVTVKETPNGIVFLHTVEPGAASKSYGIEVARLAGLPASVIGRAREVLKLHERAETQQVAAALTASAPAADAPPLQLTMFTPLSQRIVDRLAATDIDNLTPRDALNLLAELQRELGGSK